MRSYAIEGVVAIAEQLYKQFKVTEEIGGMIPGKVKNKVAPGQGGI